MASITRYFHRVSKYICIVMLALAVYHVIRNYTDIPKSKHSRNIAERFENTLQLDLKEILLIHSEKENTNSKDEEREINRSFFDEVKNRGNISQLLISEERNSTKETKLSAGGAKLLGEAIEQPLGKKLIPTSSSSSQASNPLGSFSAQSGSSLVYLQSEINSNGSTVNDAHLSKIESEGLAFKASSASESLSSSTETTSVSNQNQRMRNKIIHAQLSQIESEVSSDSEVTSSLPKDSQTCTDSTRKKIAWFLVPRWIKDYPNKEMFEDCDYSCCSIDFSSMYTEYNQSKNLDAIFFDAHTLLAPEPLQRPPSKDQMWIFFSLEPPPFISKTHWTHDNWKHVFNWTMTYRTDSDLVMPYMAVEKGVKDPHYVPKDYDLIMAKKTRKAMWLCSHCVDKHGRMSYVRKLNESIQIDVFGKCGNLMCELTCDAAYDMSKFFLAFENAFCKDYITEKPCNALIRDIIPVLRGGGNHSEFLPPNTYIDANDFESVEDLGKYLNYLDSNDTAYLEYLKNKEGYRFRCNSMITRKPMYCELCKKLHNLDVYGKSIPDIREWLQSCPDEVKVTFDNQNNYKYFN